MRLAVAILGLAAIALPVLANAPTPSAAGQPGQVKALSAAEIDDLRSGRGMGMAKAAELNSYPGPAHVLELRQALSLSVEQAESAQQLRDAMTNEARMLGERIVEREAALDRLFREGNADAAAVTSLSVEIGALQGRLRAVHLATHIAMKRLLRAEQVAAYDRLRGYQPTADTSPAPHGVHKH